MKPLSQKILRAGLHIAALSFLGIAPSIASAAVVTVTDPVTVVLPSDGSTYTVGPVSPNTTGTFDVLDVSSGTMAFTMTAGESVQITATNNRVLTNDGGFNYNCAAQSTLILSASGSITVNVTPGSTCSFSAGSGGGSSGGGGGGGSIAVPIPVSQSAATSTATTTSPVQAGNNAPTTALGGMTGGTTAYAFTKDLVVGAKGLDVKALQQYLNTHGFPVALKGAGSRGHENFKFGLLTKAALRKFQRAAGIVPANGNFGPKTRAFIAAHP